MMSVSLDGYIEVPNREIDWHLVDDELHRHFNEQLRGMGAFLGGRVTYELMAGYWPTADTDPSSTPPMIEFARIWRGIPDLRPCDRRRRWQAAFPEVRSEPQSPAAGDQSLRQRRTTIALSQRVTS
jgi:hypothetical protein